MDTATQKTSEVKDHIATGGDPYYAHRLLADDNARVHSVGPAPGAYVWAWLYPDGSHAALWVVNGPDEDSITEIYTANTLQQSFLEILAQPCFASDSPPDSHQQWDEWRAHWHWALHRNLSDIIKQDWLSQHRN